MCVLVVIALGGWFYGQVVTSPTVRSAATRFYSTFSCFFFLFSSISHLQVPFEEGIRRTAEWYRDATEEGLFDDLEDSASSNADGTSNATGLTERDRSCSLLSVVSEGVEGETSGRSSPTEGEKIQNFLFLSFVFVVFVSVLGFKFDLYERKYCYCSLLYYAVMVNCEQIGPSLF